MLNLAWDCHIRASSCVKGRKGQALKPKTADLLATAFLNMLEELNLSAKQLAEVILKIPISAKYRKLTQETSKAVLAGKLRLNPEPTKEQRKQVLAMIAAFKKAPQTMRPFLKKAIKDLPRSRSGPDRKLTPDEEITACMQIASLRGGEYSNRQIIQQIAHKNSVSERTMYRIWAKCNPNRKKKNPTVADR
jgi:hypothetical protein